MEHDRLRRGMSRAGRGLVAVVFAVAGLAACGDDGATKAASTGTAAGAPSDSAAVTQPSVAPCTFSGATAEVEGNPDAPTRLLTDVRVGAHECYERVTFEFKPQRSEADGPVSWHAAYEAPPITEDGSGRTVSVKGGAFLVIRFSAAGVDLSQEAAPPSYTGPAVLETAGTSRIQQVRRIGDFEGVLTWVVGLDRQRPFHVAAQDGPARVVLDVGD